MERIELIVILFVFIITWFISTVMGYQSAINNIVKRIGYKPPMKPSELWEIIETLVHDAKQYRKKK